MTEPKTQPAADSILEAGLSLKEKLRADPEKLLTLVANLSTEVFVLQRFVRELMSTANQHAECIDELYEMAVDDR